MMNGWVVVEFVVTVTDVDNRALDTWVVKRMEEAKTNTNI